MLHISPLKKLEVLLLLVLHLQNKPAEMPCDEFVLQTIKICRCSELNVGQNGGGTKLERNLQTVSVRSKQKHREDFKYQTRGKKKGDRHRKTNGDRNENKVTEEQKNLLD